jgi:hypothetical protein
LEETSIKRLYIVHGNHFILTNIKVHRIKYLLYNIHVSNFNVGNNNFLDVLDLMQKLIKQLYCLHLQLPWLL